MQKSRDGNELLHCRIKQTKFRVQICVFKCAGIFHMLLQLDWGQVQWNFPLSENNCIYFRVGLGFTVALYVDIRSVPFPSSKSDDAVRN